MLPRCTDDHHVSGRKVFGPAPVPVSPRPLKSSAQLLDPRPGPGTKKRYVTRVLACLPPHFERSTCQSLSNLTAAGCHTLSLGSRFVIKNLFKAMWGLWYLLRHMKDLPTDEQLKEAGIEPARYSSPPPWVFNQRGHRGRGC